MPIREHHVTTARTARYYTTGGTGSALAAVWFVIHGYGQLAAYFLQHFERLARSGPRLIVAPEALSRFYLQNGYGRVGASWMTREDRTREIADYVRYLDGVHEAVFAEAGVARQDVRVHVLGFSQGCPTATRWSVLGRHRPDRLILWAGDVPHDLDLAAHAEALRGLDLTLVYGSEDEYISAERVAKEEARLGTHRIPYQKVTFDGPHRLDAEVLEQLAAG